MTLAADCFRCSGTRCPDYIRETCRRFVDLKVGVGPGTPYADASLKTVTTYISAQHGDRSYVDTVPMDWSQGPCLHKWPLTSQV